MIVLSKKQQQFNKKKKENKQQQWKMFVLETMFIMPINNKGSALITQVLTHLYVYVHFQVFPKPNVMFTLLLLFIFLLFITKTTPICHQNG